MYSVEQLGFHGVAHQELLGRREVVRRGRRVVEPLYGLRDVKVLLSVGGERDDVAMERVMSDAGVNSAGMKLFREMKQVRRLPIESGAGVQVVPNIPGLNFDSLSQYADTEEEFGVPPDMKPAVVDERHLRYKLNSVFSDVTLADKLEISSQRMQLTKRLAVSDPSRAAVSLTEYLREKGFPNVSVSAGDYAKTAACASMAIRRFARTIVYEDLHPSGSFSVDKCLITYDKYEDDPQWTVVGPLKYAVETMAVYQLAVANGPQWVMFALGVETAILQIGIRDFETEEYYTGRVIGYSSLEGIKPKETSMAFPEDLTSDQKIRLLAASKKVKPVLVGDSVVGSAVQLTDRHVVLNEHTVVDAADADVVPDLCGEPLTHTRAVAHDICMAVRDSGPAQWVLRVADVGERAVLIFSVGDGLVEYSEVLSVLAVHQETLLLSPSNVLRKGASGAAVVSLRDGAMLGIFSTMRAHNVVCAALTSNTFRLVTDLESVASTELATTPGFDFGDRTYQHMEKRGLLGYLEGLFSACATVYVDSGGSQRIAGSIANWAGNWLTTVNPDVGQLSLQGGQMLSFRRHGGLQYSCVAPPPILQAMPNVREVQPGERVFVFVPTGEEVAMTRMRQVAHCHADMVSFECEDFGNSEEELTGGLIVAERDAAVVGQVVRPVVDAFGKTTVLCASFHSSVPSVRDSFGFVDVPRTDMREVALELKEQYVVDEQRKSLAEQGTVLLQLVAKHSAYARGMSYVDGDASIQRNWDVGYERVLVELGWSVGDWIMFAGHAHEVVARSFIALLFMREPAVFMTRVGSLLQDPMLSERTPLVGDFPFPRASSTDTAGTYRLSGVSDDSVRLRDLEERLASLTRFVAEGGTVGVTPRGSPVITDYVPPGPSVRGSPVAGWKI